VNEPIGETRCPSALDTLFPMNIEPRTGKEIITAANRRYNTYLSGSGIPFFMWRSSLGLVRNPHGVSLNRSSTITVSQ
jgi:hypothetical protein